MTETPKKRPLSPHLQVYKPQMTSMLSILHRATGSALAVGFAVFIWFLAALAAGGEHYDCFMWMFGTIAGKIALFGWSWAICYHACTGFRHLIWDMGYGFEISQFYKGAYAVLIVSTILTACVWAIGLGVL